MNAIKSMVPLPADPEIVAEPRAEGATMLHLLQQGRSVSHFCSIRNKRQERLFQSVASLLDKSLLQ